jgi:hypothetical protein
MKTFNLFCELNCIKIVDFLCWFYQDEKFLTLEKKEPHNSGARYHLVAT